MMDFAVFLAVFFVAVRTFGYGIWTFRGKNAPGGIFVILLSVFLVIFGAYICFRSRT